MRVLIVSYYFTPYNTIGAVRVGKTARYLWEMGHDVRVLAARDQPLQPTLPLEIPDTNVTRTPWLNVNAPAELVFGGRDRVATHGFSAPPKWRALARFLGLGYKTVTNFPDAQVGWLPYAVRAGKELCADWRPDIILASAKPTTSLLIGAHLARRFWIPWVAELRDLLVDDVRYPYPAPRRSLERLLERRTLSSATGIVTVSQPYAEHLQTHYLKPVETVLNGYDSIDVPISPQPAAREDKLQIVYTGMIYDGCQDVTPLFRALRMLGDEAHCVRVRFFGRYLDSLARLTERYGINCSIEIAGSVPYHEALCAQQRADILLLLLVSSSEPLQRGIYTGKLFEYLGARRPILALGKNDNVAAELLVSRGAGVVLNDPVEIAAQLRSWLSQKRTSVGIDAVPAEAMAGLSRREQTARLAAFLGRIVADTNAARPAALRPHRTAA